MDDYLKDKFYQKLCAYQPFNEQEQVDKQVMLSYLTKFKDIYERTNIFAHMTSSPWIINEQRDKILMVHHHIYQSWSWCGGHCDGDKDLVAVALREGMEETGLKHLTLVSQDLFAIDVLPVRRHKKQDHFISAHIHLNTTYLCIADEREQLKPKTDENSQVAWIPIQDVLKIVTEEDMIPVYTKLCQKLNTLKKSSG